MTGVLVNVIAIVVGTLLGITVGRFFSQELRDIAFKVIGLAVAVSGLTMTLEGLDGLAVSRLAEFSMVHYTAALIIGAIIGQALGIEALLARAGEGIQTLTKRITGVKPRPEAVVDPDADVSAGEKFVEGFASASIIFVVGAMSILGSIQAGLGDPSLLYLKSVLDGITSIILGSTLGVGVAFSGLAVLLFQGALALGAQALAPLFSDPVVAGISAVGGTLIIGIGMNFMGVIKLSVGNMLPGVVIIALLAGFLG